MQGASPQQRMSFVLQLAFIELCQHEAGVSNCVDSDIVSASVRSAPGELQLHPEKASMRGANRESRWLRNDCSLCVDPTLDERSHPEALVLLVSYRCDNDLAPSVSANCIAGQYRRRTHRRDSCLHIGGATTE